MSFTGEFKKFALRGNLTDMAIGFTVGAAFTATAKSLVDDLVMPPIGLLLGRSDFSDMYLLLAPGEAAPPYASLAAAQEAGAVTWNYGAFINTLIAFLLVAIVMFLVIKAVNRMDRELERRAGAEDTADDEPDNKKCPFCLSTVAAQAVRCPLCTSYLDGRPRGAAAATAPGESPPGFAG